MFLLKKKHSPGFFDALYNVDEKSVRLWKEKKEVLEKLQRNKRAMRRRNAYWPELENELKNWVLSEWEKGLRISTPTILLKSKIIAREMGINDFKAYPSWCFRFMRRHNLSIRTISTAGQNLPEDWEAKAENFRLFVKKHLKSIESRHFGNMDDVPVSFDMPSTWTVNLKGAKKISLRTAGNEKSNFTVVLAITSDGTKLPPMVIFKRKTIPKEKFPEGIIVKTN
jgi:hypothetical protein